MILSDNKIAQITNVILRGLIEKDLIILKTNDIDVRKEIKRTIINELKIGEDIDNIVRKKIASFSKKIVEGSSEWSVLYRKFFEEEGIRRGIA